MQKHQKKKQKKKHYDHNCVFACFYQFTKNTHIAADHLSYF